MENMYDIVIIGGGPGGMQAGCIICRESRVACGCDREAGHWRAGNPK